MGRLEEFARGCAGGGASGASERLPNTRVLRGYTLKKTAGLPFRESPAVSSDGGAENRTRVQRPTPKESTCLDASPLPVLLRRVRRARVSETSKTPRAPST